VSLDYCDAFLPGTSTYSYPPFAPLRFKAADKEFSTKHEARSDLESYLHQVETNLASPELGSKIKRGARSQIEQELAKALEKLENADSTGDELKRAQLGLKRAMQKAMAGAR